MTASRIFIYGFYSYFLYHYELYTEFPSLRLSSWFPAIKSTLTLLEVYHETLNLLVEGREGDVVHIDLLKARFQKVPHYLSASKLQPYGVSGSILQWFSGYYSDSCQHVGLEYVFSGWPPLSSGVPQGFIFFPLLFLVYANWISGYSQRGSGIALFAGDSKPLYMFCRLPAGGLVLQTQLGALMAKSSTLGYIII